MIRHRLRQLKLQNAVHVVSGGVPYRRPHTAKCEMKFGAPMNEFGKRALASAIEWMNLKSGYQNDDEVRRVIAQARQHRSEKAINRIRDVKRINRVFYMTWDVREQLEKYCNTLVGHIVDIQILQVFDDAFATLEKEEARLHKRIRRLSDDIDGRVLFAYQQQALQLAERAFHLC
jgi:hypothetical protein